MQGPFSIKKLMNSGQFNVKVVLTFAISFFLLWLTFRNSGMQMSDIKLNGIQWIYFLVASLTFMFYLYVYSLRSQLIWRGTKLRTDRVDTLSSYIIGGFYNCLLPGNLGEAVCVWHFKKKNNASLSQSLAGVITEKWLDAQVFLVLTITACLWKFPSSNYIFTIFISISLAVLALSIVYAFFRRNRNVEKKLWNIIILVRKPGIFLYRVYRIVTGQIVYMQKNGLWYKYVAWCGIIVALNFTQFWFLMEAAEIVAPVKGLYTCLMVAVGMMVIALIPSAPSNIGSMHYGLYAILLLSASQHNFVPDAAAIKSYALFSVYVHLSFFISEIFLGLIFLVKERAVLFDKPVLQNIQ